MKKCLPFHENHTVFLGLLFVLLGANWLRPATSIQTQDLQWASPSTIPGLDLTNYPPILVADQNKTVHAFSTQWVDNPNGAIRAIVYSQWTLAYGWTAPIDVIVSPRGEARVTSAFLDKNGIMHVAFYGGNGVSGDIYYTRALASVANNATAWTVPVAIGENAGDPESAVFVGDGQDQLSLIYHGRSSGYGVYVVNSADGGGSWSSPSPIFLSDGDAPYVSKLSAIMSTSGWYHVIWNTFSESGQGRGIYYARAKVGDTQWSDPILMASANEGLGPQTPTILEYKDVLYAIYNMTPKITMRRSMDDGQSWDDPIVLFGRFVGVNGSLSLVVDGNDVMHLFFAQRISGSLGTSDIHGMWHSSWLNDRWVEPSAVVKGPRIVDEEGTSGFDPYEAHAVVSQGDVLLVTWRTDPGDIKDNGIWYSYAVINAPEKPIATLQLPIVTQQLSQAELATPTIEVSPTPVIELDRERRGQNPIVWVIVGLLVLGFFRILFVLFTRNS